MVEEIHEGWHETDFNKLPLAQSIVKEVYKDMKKAIWDWAMEEGGDKLHFGEITSEVFSKYIDVNKTEDEIEEDGKKRNS